MIVANLEVNLLGYEVWLLLQFAIILLRTFASLSISECAFSYHFGVFFFLESIVGFCYPVYIVMSWKANQF